MREIDGRYRLVTRAGSGGAGVVWRAYDELLHRQVAIKEVPLGLDRLRTLREPKLAARLSHPGIVTVHDLVEREDRLWIVMEYLEGFSLEQTVRLRGPLSPALTATIGRHLLSALRYAHESGILHRDIKPANVMLTDGRVVLTDFGLALAEGHQTAAFRGTPAYMAPERLRGGPASRAADLWSFGATLYAAVEGRPPYAGRDLVEILGAALRGGPLPAERAGPLRPLLDGLLAPDPADRLTAGRAAQLLESGGTALGRAS